MSQTYFRSMGVYTCSVNFINEKRVEQAGRAGKTHSKRANREFRFTTHFNLVAFFLFWILKLADGSLTWSELMLTFFSNFKTNLSRNRWETAGTRNTPACDR